MAVLLLMTISTIPVEVIGATGNTPMAGESRATLDSDVDGLSDEYEILIGSDPNNADSDHDGLEDGEDPTPTGNLIITVDDITVYDFTMDQERIVLMSGDDLVLDGTINEVKPDGSREGISGSATITIFSRSWGSLSRKEVRTTPLTGSDISFSYSTSTLGSYVAVVSIGDSADTLGRWASMSELSALNEHGKAAYFPFAVFPEDHVTMDNDQRTLLVDHTVTLDLEHYSFVYNDTLEDETTEDSSWVRWPNARNNLDKLYTQTAGSASLSMRKGSTKSSLGTVTIGASGSTYSHQLPEVNWYSFTAAPATSPHQDSSAYVSAIDRLVTWVDVEQEFAATQPVSIGRYTLSGISEDQFSDLYSEIGLRRIVEQYPQFADAESATVVLDLYFVGSARGDGNSYSLRLSRKTVSLTGTGGTTIPMDVPGSLRLGVSWDGTPTWSGSKTSIGYSSTFYNQYDDFQYLYVKSGYHFTTRPTQDTFFTKSTDSYSATQATASIIFAHASTDDTGEAFPVDIYLGTSKKTTRTTEPGITYSYSFTGRGVGHHDYTAIVRYSDNVDDIVSAFGSQVYADFANRGGFNVEHYGTIANAPTQLTAGETIRFRTIVFGDDGGIAGATVKASLARYSTTSKVVFNGQTDTDGSVLITFTVPDMDTSSYIYKGEERLSYAAPYNRLDIDVDYGGVDTTLERYVTIRTGDERAYMSMDKTLYRPGEDYNLDLLVWDRTGLEVVTGDVELILIDPAERVVSRETLTLDDLGHAPTDGTFPDTTVTGEYTFMAFQEMRLLGERMVTVDEYEPPTVELVYRDVDTADGLINPGIETSIPIQVQYLHGAPLLDGEVSYTIKGYNESRYTYYWYGGCGWLDDCMDVEYSYTGGAVASDYYEPYRSPGTSEQLVEVYDSQNTVDVEEGWANLTITLPERMDRLVIEGTFTDDSGHETTASHDYEVDANRVEFEVEVQEAYPVAADLGFEMTFEADEDDPLDYTLEVTLTGYDSFTAIEETLFEGAVEPTTGTLLLSDMGLDLTDILSRDIFQYHITGRLVGEGGGKELQVATFDERFFVEVFEFTLETASLSYGPGETVSLTSTAMDLRNGTPLQYDYTYSLFIGEAPYRFSDDYQSYYYYYDWYGGYDYYWWYDDDPGLLLREYGVVDGTGDHTWAIPDRPAEGTYTAVLEFETGGLKRHVVLPFEVRSDEVVSFTPDTPDSFTPGTDITLPLDFSGTFDGTVYVDISQGEDRNFLTEMVSVTEASSTHTLTIGTSTLRADVHVDIYYTQGDILVMTSASISPEVPELEVDISYDKDSYEPGDLVKVMVEVTEDGQPAQVPWLALSIVDDAVFTVSPDADDSSFHDLFSSAYTVQPVLLWTFNLDQHTPVEYVLSKSVHWPEDVYARVVTPPTYTIDNPRTALKSGDAGQETDNEVYYEAQDGVATDDSDGMTADAGGVPAPSDQNLAGGGGAGEEPEGDAQRNDSGSDHTTTDAELTGDLADLANAGVVRDDIRDIAYWSPLYPRAGFASWFVELPDNLARWRVRATAVDDDLRAAVATSHFNATKDFFLEVDFPQRVTQDDELLLRVRINNMEQETPVTVGISAEWLEVFGESQVTVLAPRGITTVPFRVKVTDAGDRAFIVVASSGSAADGISQDVFVRPNGALSILHEAGSLEGATTITFVVHDEAISEGTKAILKLMPGYDSVLLDTLDGMGRYGYGSYYYFGSLVNSGMRYHYLDVMDGLTLDQERAYQRQTTRTMTSLRDWQCPDGGFGYWTHRPRACHSKVATTSNIVLGMAEAKYAGLPVDRTILGDAIDYLGDHIGEDGMWQATGHDPLRLTLLTAYAVTLAGGSSDITEALSYLDSRFTSGAMDDDPFFLGVYGRLALIRTQTANTDEAVSLLLAARSNFHWAEGSAVAGADESTGWVLSFLVRYEALNGADFQGTDLGAVTLGGFEWLTAARSQGGLGTVMDTFAAAQAFLGAAEVSGAIDADYEVAVDGDVIASGHVDSSNKEAFRDTYYAWDITEYLAQGGTITVNVEGTGKLFYEFTGVQYLRTDITATMDDSLTVTRGQTEQLTIHVTPDTSDQVRVTDIRADILGPTGIVQTGQTVAERAADGAVGTGFDITLDVLGLETSLDTYAIRVSYVLDSEGRGSGIVRTYYGPFDLDVVSGTRSSGDTSTTSSLEVFDVSGPSVAPTGDTVFMTIPVSSIRTTLLDSGVIQSSTTLVAELGDDTWTVTPTGDDPTFSLTSLTDGTVNPGRIIVSAAGVVVAVSEEISVTFSDSPIVTVDLPENMDLDEPFTMDIEVGGTEVGEYRVEVPLAPGWEVDTELLEGIIGESIRSATVDDGTLILLMNGGIAAKRHAVREYCCGIRIVQYKRRNAAQEEYGGCGSREKCAQSKQRKTPCLFAKETRG